MARACDLVEVGTAPPRSCGPDHATGIDHPGQCWKPAVMTSLVVQYSLPMRTSGPHGAWHGRATGRREWPSQVLISSRPRPRNPPRSTDSDGPVGPETHNWDGPRRDWFWWGVYVRVASIGAQLRVEGRGSRRKEISDGGRRGSWPRWGKADVAPNYPKTNPDYCLECNQM